MSRKHQTDTYSKEPAAAFVDWRLKPHGWRTKRGLACAARGVWRVADQNAAEMRQIQRSRGKLSLNLGLHMRIF